MRAFIKRLGPKVFLLILLCFTLLTGGLVAHTYWVSKRLLPEMVTAPARTSTLMPAGDTVPLSGAAAAEREFNRYLIALAKEYIFVIVVSGAFTFLAVFFFFRRLVTDRIKTISGHFQTLAARINTTGLSPVPTGGADEISDLASSFNLLLARLTLLQKNLEDQILQTSAANRELEGEIRERRAAEVRLQELNETLEARVAERTATLSATLERLKQETEERLKTSKDLDRIRKCFHGAVENSKDAIIVTDHEGIVHYFNPQSEKIFGIQRQEMTGTHLGIPITAGDTVEIDILHSAGSTGVGDMQVSETFWDDQEAFLITIRDITERKGFEKNLARLAGHDHLTGLCNRRRFEELFQREMDRVLRYNESGALIWFDLDNFKDINDFYGHRSGDEFLVHVAQLLQNRLRESDVAARFGDDEFTILLPKADMEQSTSLASQLLRHINSITIQSGQDVIRTTASIGVVIFPEHGKTIEELLTRADTAMYQAKQNGRNCYVVHDPAASPPASGDNPGVIMAERIRDGLEKQLFELHLQPIYSTNTAQNTPFFEVLLRLRDRQDGIIAPSSFMPLAEKVGLVRWIDRWVVGTLLQTMKAMDAIRPDARYSVNLSAKTLSDDSFLPFVRDEINQAGIDPGRLVFEVTESAAITNLLNAQNFIDRLHAIGCNFALDDFGVGFSSFSYIKHLPVGYLKIDGSFIRNLAENEEDQLLVRALLDIARGLGKKTVAEWVETEKTMTILQKMRVDYVQGYLFGRPAHWAEALRL